MEPRNDRAVALRGRGTYKVCRLAWGAEWSGTCELNVVLACFDRWHCAAMTHGFEEGPFGAITSAITDGIGLKP